MSARCSKLVRGCSPLRKVPHWWLNTFVILHEALVVRSATLFAYILAQRSYRDMLAIMPLYDLASYDLPD